MTSRVRLLCSVAALSFWLLAPGADAGPLPGTPQQDQQPRAFEDVVAALKSADPRARLEAVEMLSASGYREAALPLAGVLADADDRVARAAVYGELGLFLGDTVSAERRVAFIFEMPKSNPAWRAFESSWGSLPVTPVPGEVVRALAERLTGENIPLRLEKIYALAVLGQVEGTPSPAQEAAAEALAQRLGDSEPVIRAAAARAAGRMFRRCAAPCSATAAQRLGDALVHTLNDPEEPVLMAAIDGLAEMRYERGLDALTRVHEYFKKGPPALAALDAIARIGARTSVPLFKAAASRREPAARRAAMEGLARAGDTEALAALAPAVQSDGNTEVVLGTAFALQRAGLGQHLPALLAAAGGKYTGLQVQDYLVELGPAVAPQVAAALGSTRGEARARLIEVLGVIGGQDELQAIDAARADGSPRVAVAADRAIRRLTPAR